MSIENHFGVDAAQMIRDRTIPLAKKWRDEHGKDVTIVLMANSSRAAAMANWDSALPYAQLIIHTGDEAAATAHGGTLENVWRKLQFFLRLQGKVRWIDAEPPYWLVFPGDFPWEGAGEHRGWIGGISGLPGGKLDWDAYVEWINGVVIPVMTEVSKAAVDRCNLRRKVEGLPISTKYIQGIDVSDMFPRYAASLAD